MLRVEQDRAVFWVGREQGGVGAQLQLLDRELATQAGDDGVAMLGGDGAVNDEQISVVDPSVDHAVALGPDIVGGRRPGNAQLVQIEGLLDIVLCRAREAASRRREEQGELQAWSVEVWDKEHGDGSFACKYIQYNGVSRGMCS